MRDVASLDNALRAHITEKRDLPFLIGRDRTVAAAKKDIRLNADRAQLFYRVLRRLCLHLTGTRNVGQKRQVNEDGSVLAEFLAKLTDGFEKWQALNIADCSPDLTEDEVHVSGITQHEVFDRVGDVRNDLNRRAKEITATFFFKNGLIDPPRRDVVALFCRHASEALIVAEIEVRFCTVICHEHLTMLVRRHRSRVDVQIRVELTKADLIAPCLEQRAKRRRRNAFSKGGDHAARNKNITRHGPVPCKDSKTDSRRELRFEKVIQDSLSFLRTAEAQHPGRQY